MINATVTPPSPFIKDGTAASFMADVVEASRTAPVIVDFWATWCGPCKALTPLLEKEVKAAKGAVHLVKIDVDRHPQISQSLRVQSIPAVYAFFQGQVVDGFMGAVPETEVKQFIHRLLKLKGAAPPEGKKDEFKILLAEAQHALEQKNFSGAAASYHRILAVDPVHAEAYAGLIRAVLGLGDVKKARQMLDQAPPEVIKNRELAAARTAVALVEQAPSGTTEDSLRQRLSQNQNDHQARFDLAMLYYTAGHPEEAVNELLTLVQKDRSWNDEAARKQLVKIFEALGPTHPLVISARRRLSSLLFS